MRTMRAENRPVRTIAPVAHPSWRAAAATATPTRQPRRGGGSLAQFWALVDADD